MREKASKYPNWSDIFRVCQWSLGQIALAGVQNLACRGSTISSFCSILGICVPHFVLLLQLSLPSFVSGSSCVMDTLEPEFVFPELAATVVTSRTDV